MLKAMAIGGNPSSVHGAGRCARTLLENARSAIAKAIGTRSQDLTFTSGGTESNNLAIAAALTCPDVKRILVSVLEHDAAYMGAHATGYPVEIITALPNGQIDLRWLEQRLANWDRSVDGRPFVCLQAVTSETGVIQPVDEAGAMIRAADGLLLVDAVQTLGKTGFHFGRSGAHYASISAHKVGGPQGVGALIVSCDAPCDLPRRGGGQEKGRRSGTENVRRSRRSRCTRRGTLHRARGVAGQGGKRHPRCRTACRRDRWRRAAHAQLFGDRHSRLGRRHAGDRARSRRYLHQRRLGLFVGQIDRTAPVDGHRRRGSRPVRHSRQSRLELDRGRHRSIHHGVDA
jgi:hypothetical protein